MSSTKDIKVTFLNNERHNATEKIRIFFKDIFSNDIQIDLRPGEIVYSQTNHLSNSLKIYSRKGIIDIKEENKPEFLKYYIGYKEEEIDNKLFLLNLHSSLIDDKSSTEKEKQTKKIKQKISKQKVVKIEPEVAKTELGEVIKTESDIDKINTPLSKDKKTQEELIEKWEKSGILDNLRQPLNTNLALLLESQEKQVIDEPKQGKTILDKAIEEVVNYSAEPKKKRKSRKGPGRPKKRGPKKGSKRKK
jgi:hypothetical protein